MIVARPGAEVGAATSIGQRAGARVCKVEILRPREERFIVSFLWQTKDIMAIR